MANGLAREVVTASVEALMRSVTPSRGQDQDGHSAGGAQSAGDFETIQARQAHVQHEEIGVVRGRCLERGDPVRGMFDTVTGLRERAIEVRRDTRIVLHDQHQRLRAQHMPGL